MILLNLNKSAPALVCPHCEEPMSEHDGLGACRKKKLSRRFFLGGLGMAAAGTVAGLAFTKAAQAELEDTVVETVLTSAADVSPIAYAAPKIHRGGAILLTYSGLNSSVQKAGIQSIADFEGRPVIFRDDDGKITTATPAGVAFETKWERPSLGFLSK